MSSLFALVFSFLYICSSTNAYSLVHKYDYANWYSSFTFETLPDPTSGFVDYISLADATALRMTKIIGNQVYMGVDNVSVISTSSAGRKSIWLESIDAFTRGLLIGDFAHMPGGVCGTWPGFWTIRNGDGTYGEIDILEGFNDISQAYTTLHTGGACTFNSPAALELGQANQDSYDCNLNLGIGCSVIGPVGSYGASFNKNGGGVYALEWTSNWIKVYFFPRNAIPLDIRTGHPNPSLWGLPTANFDSQYGNCDIDANFPPQTIYFDTTFCGAEAGGQAWTSWTDCSSVTEYPTCEDFVAGVPSAFDEAYWLINSVEFYQ